MKLATLPTAPATVSSSWCRGISRAAWRVPEIARTLQAALDVWQGGSTVAAAIADELDLPADARARAVRSRRTPWRRCRAPTQWADGSGLRESRRARAQARGRPMPPEFWTDPLMYQGASDHMLGACAGHRAGRRRMGHRFSSRSRGDHRRRPHGQRRPPCGKSTSVCCCS
jgi:fumarylacetoacetate (FAA) hydrolase